jgi:carboxypeptidase Taq
MNLEVTGPSSRWSSLRTRLAEIEDLRASIALLEWDQSTYMPDGGGAARGRQLATLERMLHNLRTSSALGADLDALRASASSLPQGSSDRALFVLAEREYERSLRVPADFVAEAKRHFAASFETWKKAKPKGDFAAVAPFLEKTVEISRRYAEFFPGHEHPVDPHIDRVDRGMTVASIRALFDGLRAELVPLVRAIGTRPSPDVAFLKRAIPVADQLEFGKSVIRSMGYDFERGRQDLTHHPFMTKFSIGDVRITTRVEENDFAQAFFATVHECGHALYEQGIDPSFEGSPLADGVSSGVHESQSRLWENRVGRSREFCAWLVPRLKRAFPKVLDDVDAERFYRAINCVKPSLVRVAADEVTYNLHIMIRFDLACELVEGKLSVKELPDAWNARYESDLGLRPSNATEGVLQDIHWYVDMIGGLFQGYTLGNVMSAQFFDAACRAHPDLAAELGRGEFGTLREWLRENVHRHGAVFDPLDLVERATGAPLGIEPFVRYLRTKFGELYALDA